MNMSKIHHYGFATSDIIKSSEYFMYLGYKIISDVIYDEKQNVKLLFLEVNGHVLELVSPIDKKSPVYNIIQKSSSTLYHICYEVESLETAIIEFRKKGFIQILKPIEAVAFDNRKITFFYHTSTGLIEFLEESYE